MPIVPGTTGRQVGIQNSQDWLKLNRFRRALYLTTLCHHWVIFFFWNDLIGVTSVEMGSSEVSPGEGCLVCLGPARPSQDHSRDVLEKFPGHMSQKTEFACEIQSASGCFRASSSCSQVSQACGPVPCRRCEWARYIDS